MSQMSEVFSPEIRLVGRTSLRIILSDVGERRLGPKRRRLAIVPIGCRSFRTKSSRKHAEIRKMCSKTGLEGYTYYTTTFGLKISEKKTSDFEISELFRVGKGPFSRDGLAKRPKSPPFLRKTCFWKVILAESVLEKEDICLQLLGHLSRF
jgi:hypothetical protein